MTYSDPESFWYSGGVWDGSWLDWVWFNIAPDLRRRLGRPGPLTDSLVSAAWSRDGLRARRHRPMLTLPEFQGLAPWYYEWMRHPPRDPWWRWAALDGRYSGVGAAVLNLSGWFDEPYGPAGAVDNYERMVATRRADARRAALVLGAWTQGGQSRDKGGPDAAVQVFVMGVNRWRKASRWPLPGTSLTPCTCTPEQP
jgi:predicted acyl esterase